MQTLDSIFVGAPQSPSLSCPAILRQEIHRNSHVGLNSMSLLVQIKQQRKKYLTLLSPQEFQNGGKQKALKLLTLQNIILPALHHCEGCPQTWLKKKSKWQPHLTEASTIFLCTSGAKHIKISGALSWPPS